MGGGQTAPDTTSYVATVEIVDPANGFQARMGGTLGVARGVAPSTFTPVGSEVISGSLPPGLSYNAATRAINGVQATLGSSGAEHTTAPRRGNSPGAPGLRMRVIDPMAPPSGGANMVRDFTPGSNAIDGTVEFRPTLTNNTGQTITRVRLRVIDITPLPVGPGNADLRVLDASNSAVTLANGSVVNVVGATLDEPPAQLFGGGGIRR